MKVNMSQFRQWAKKAVVVGVLVFAGDAAFAQSAEANNNPYVKLGQKALIDGDFKTAVANLEKAVPSDPDNAIVLYMLGYSQYQSNDYKGAIKSFSSVIKAGTNDVPAAYYWRGRAQNMLAVDPDSKMNDAQRTKMLEASVQDYTSAIQLDNADLKNYQNRAMAYRDLGNLVGTPTSKNFNKGLAAGYYDNAIKDLQLVMKRNPGRKDLNQELKKLKVYKESL
jgi:tetratricopeptide (TPR) repeat protein